MNRLNGVLLVVLLSCLLFQARSNLKAASEKDSKPPAGGPYVLGSGQIIPAADDKERPELPVKVSEVEIENVYQNGPGLVIMLERKDGPIEGKLYMPIFVGTNEALAIARELATPKVVPPRPMTHDLLRTIIGSLKADVDRITVTRLTGGTFFAVITLIRDGKKIYVDARPSDSMALAIRAKARIFVADEVMREAGQAEITRPDQEQEPEDHDRMGMDDEQEPEARPTDEKSRRMYYQHQGFH